MKLTSLVPWAMGLFCSSGAIAATAIVPTDYATIQAAVTAVQGTVGAQVIVNSNATFPENIIATQSVWIAAGVGFSPLIRPAAGSAITLQPSAATDELFTLSGLRVQGCGTNADSIIHLDNRNTAGSAFLNMTDMDIANPGCGSDATGLRIAKSAFVTGTSNNRVSMEDSSLRIANLLASSVAVSMHSAPGRLFIARSLIDVANGTALDLIGNGSGGPPGTNIEAAIYSTRFQIASTGGTTATAIRLTDNTRSEILGNRFAFADGSYNAVGVHIEGTLLGNTHTITRNTFSRASKGSGSGVRLYPKGNATYGAQTGTAIVTNNVMHNLEQGIDVWPQYTGDTGTLTAINNTINNARRCLNLYAGDGTTINGRFSNNLCTNISGSIENVGGVPVVYGAIAAYERPGANITMSFANNGFYNNAHGDYSPMVAGIPNAAAVVTTNPIYANPLSGDLRLRTGSPAIDAGITEASVTVDHDDNPRPQAAAYDIGAFEGAYTLVPSVPSLGPFATALLSLILAALAIGLQPRNSKIP